MWQRRAAALVGRAILRRDRRGPRDSRAVTGTMGRYATAYQRPRRTPIEPNAPALTTLRLAPRGCVGRGLATLMLVRSEERRVGKEGGAGGGGGGGERRGGGGRGVD